MASSIETASIAVVGMGSISERHRCNLKILFPEVTIVGLSSSGRTLTELPVACDLVATSLQEVIEKKPRFVIVASPATVHVEHAKQLLLAGIPTLIEKPIAADIESATALLDIAAQCATPVAVAYCLRYLPSLVAVKNLLSTNALGRLYNVNISVGQFLPEWRTNKSHMSSVSVSKKLGGGVLLELSHEFDYARYLLGILEPKFAILRHSELLNLEVEELADISLLSGDGVVCNLHLDFLQKESLRTCQIIGEKGRIEWDLIQNRVILISSGEQKTLSSNPDWESNMLYLDMLQDFWEFSQDKKIRALATVEDALETVRLVSNVKEMAIWGEAA